MVRNKQGNSEKMDQALPAGDTKIKGEKSELHAIVWFVVCLYFNYLLTHFLFVQIRGVEDLNYDTVFILTVDGVNFKTYE
jgi:hypothetical protein